mmetsp:Transcript_14268/g.34421  ORF Transcript_14268/g.34421 Transcript_14268/m.34421 type:complete len:92 (-) Transcript_14268:185-460(-)
MSRIVVVMFKRMLLLLTLMRQKLKLDLFLLLRTSEKTLLVLDDDDNGLDTAVVLKFVVPAEETSDGEHAIEVDEQRQHDASLRRMMSIPAS